MEVNLSLLIAGAALCLSVLITAALWIVSRRSNARLTEALAQQQQQLSALKSNSISTPARLKRFRRAVW